MALNRKTNLENLQILGLETDASQADIKKAYKKLALKYHPDKNLEDTDATARFQELSKAYLDLKSEKERTGHRHQFYCPTHGYWSCSDSDFSDDEYDVDDEECSSEVEGDLLYFFRKVFLDVFSEFVFEKRFYASRKHQKLSPEDKEEDLFFDFIHKKYREENPDEYELTEEDLRKFHSYEEWQKETGKRRRRNRKGRAKKRKKEKFLQEVPKPLSRKEEMALQKKREQEMKKIGEELARTIKTKSSTTNKKQAEKQCDCISKDEKVAEELRTQAENKRLEEERIKETLKLAEAEEKKKEKQNKRKEKKNQRKQKKLHSLQTKPDEENQGEENIFLKRLKEMHQTSYDLKENKMVSEDLKKASGKNVQEMSAKSSLLAHHFGISPTSRVHRASPTRLQAESQSGNSLASEPSKKPSSELLKHHLEIYEEMMKVQPRRHTEQQIKVERTKEREKLLQKQQEELERLRGEHRSQFGTRPTKESSNSDDMFTNTASFQEMRNEILQQQREQEKRRNQEEDFDLSTQKMYEIKKKKQEPKWYEKDRPTPKMPHNPMKRSSPEIWVPPPAPSKETVWAKRQQEQEQKQAALQELLPHSEKEEEEMLKKALEVSEREATEERARKKLAREMSAKLSRSYEPDYKAPGHNSLPAHTCVMLQPHRPNPEEPYSSIWDIEEKADPLPIESTPCPWNMPQHKGPPSYAKITSQSKLSGPPSVVSNPRPVQKQRITVTDTQMDLERAELNSRMEDTNPWNMQNESWNSATKPLSAYDPQSLESLESESSSSSLSSSIETASSNESSTDQKHSLGTRKTCSSFCETRESPNITHNSYSKSERSANDLLSIDKNNNVCMTNNFSGIDEAHKCINVSTSKSLDVQKTVENPLQTNKTSNAKTTGRGGFGVPTNPKKNIKAESVQKQHKPTDNLSSRDELAELKTNVHFRPGRNTGEKAMSLNKVGFERYTVKRDKGLSKQSVEKQSEDYSEKSVALGLENWDEAIEDFPSDVKQIYFYCLDHVNTPVSRNRVFSEKELVTTHKRELNFKKMEPRPEGVGLDTIPVETREVMKLENDVRKIHSNAIAATPTVSRNTDTKLNTTNLIASEQDIINSRDSHAECIRRLPVLKDLSKSPEIARPTYVIPSDTVAETIPGEQKRNPLEYQEHVDYNKYVNTDLFSLSDKGDQEMEHSNTTGEQKYGHQQGYQKDIMEHHELVCNTTQENVTPDKENIGPEQYMVKEGREKTSTDTADLPSESAIFPDTQTSAAMSTMPSGLPPHLIQAYLQYLTQSATETTTAGQSSGLVGGLLPGLGLGMPVVSPFANPLYTPVMPFGMNPMILNPLLALSLQSQEQLLAGQLGATLSNTCSSDTKVLERTDNEPVDQPVEEEQKQNLERIVDGVGTEYKENSQGPLKSDGEELENTSVNILPLFKNMNIEAQENIKQQHIPLNKRGTCNTMPDQEPLSRLQCSDEQKNHPLKLLEMNTCVARPPGKTENLLPDDSESMRIRRPSKEQTVSLRIPREPSVSSKLHGVQSSPVTDDPAVVRMSAAEIISQTDHKVVQTRSSTLDEDPSVIRYEQKSGSITSPEKAYELDFHLPMNTNEGFPQNYDIMQGWMNDGHNIFKTVMSSSNRDREASSNIADIQRGSNNLNTVFSQQSKSATDVTFTHQSSFRVSGTKQESSLDNLSNQTVRGRGGFGTPSMPRRPQTSISEIETVISNNQSENSYRPSFTTKSLSERFAGIKREGGEGWSSKQLPQRPQAGGDGFSSRRLPPRLLAQREKNQQVKDMLSQIRKEREASEQAEAAIELNQRTY